jgi:hypothetical protein
MHGRCGQGGLHKANKQGGIREQIGVAPKRRSLPTQPMNSKPTLLCWITCDAIHIDPATGKHTILGMYSGIRAAKFPFTCPFMVWFLSVTDCQRGPHRLKISMGPNPENMTALLERPFESQDPVQRINLINEVSNLYFAEPGDYGLLIEIDDEPILATSLMLSN